MKFKIVETKKKPYGREALLQYLKDKQKRKEFYAKKQEEKQEKQSVNKDTGEIKEQAGMAGPGVTSSGAGFPAATDAAGGRAIDKFPGGASRKKKKKATMIARRIQPSLLHAQKKFVGRLKGTITTEDKK